jgi:hypothetical protein
MKLSKRAIWIASIAALPFVALASWLWYVGATDRSMPDAYISGDLIYMLGYPLTKIMWQFHPNDRDMWWAIPLADALFILQWIIWGQLIAYLIRLFKPKHR